MFKFKPANPDSRLPSFLQAHTKENIIFQLSAMVILMLAMGLKDEYDMRQMEKRLAYSNNPTPVNE